MKISDGPLEGLKIIELPVHGDNRGFFVERFNLKRFADAGLPHIYMQDNHSRSAPGVLRGLHYQFGPPQGKLVGVTRGKLWDVAVDIRPHSSTYGQHFSIELTGENGILFYMPPGFAHGFCVLGDEPADLLYKVTSVYNAPGESGIAYDDPEIGIKWPLSNPEISERDKKQQSFAQYKKSPPSWPV